MELLAILLGTGRPGHPVVEVAQGVYRSAGGSLRRLAGLPLGQLRVVGGVGGAKAGRLVAALELGRRLAREERPPRVRIRTPEDVVRIIGDRIRDLEVEEFHVLVMSIQREVVRTVLISRGVLTGSMVHPREVFRPAIVEAAARQLGAALETNGADELKVWLGRLQALALVQTVGRTLGMRYFIDPALLRGADLKIPTTLLRIEPHRLSELIREDLRRYPNSKIGEISRRIGSEVSRSQLKRALTALVSLSAVSMEGARNGARYRLVAEK